MLKKVLSISGKPGLYKLISQGKNMFVAESMIDQKRIPIYSKDKVVSLSDISIVAEGEDVPLSVVFTTIFTKQNREPIDIQANIQPLELRTYFESVLPTFDREKVYPSDIKKILSWYNILLAAGFTEFENKEEEENIEPSTEETKGEKGDKADKIEKIEKVEKVEKSPVAKSLGPKKQPPKRQQQMQRMKNK